MGSFVETAWRCVKWVGKCILEVVDWWIEFMDSVNSLVHSFLMRVRKMIEEAENPRTVGEVIAIKKEKEQLDKKADELYKTLSQNDKNRVDEILSKKNY